MSSYLRPAELFAELNARQYRANLAVAHALPQNIDQPKRRRAVDLLTEAGAAITPAESRRRWVALLQSTRRSEHMTMVKHSRGSLKPTAAPVSHDWGKATGGLQCSKCGSKHAGPGQPPQFGCAGGK